MLLLYILHECPILPRPLLARGSNVDMGVCGSGSGVSGAEASGLGFRVSGFQGFRDQGVGFRV